LILSGSVEVIKRVIAKEAIDHETLAILGPGETFGEMELVDLQPRSATIRTLEPVRVLSLSGSDLNILSIEDRRIFSMVVMNLAREISLRLRQTDTWLAGSLFSIRRAKQM
ncbi:MAG: cyclic nucleotide-binding domain-containing protein, partial [Verrucomicrobiota bacterium]